MGIVMGVSGTYNRLERVTVCEPDNEDRDTTQSRSQRSEVERPKSLCRAWVQELKGQRTWSKDPGSKDEPGRKLGPAPTGGCSPLRRGS